MTQLTRQQQAAALEKDWAENPRWKGIKRGYTAADVVRLRGSITIEHTLAKRGAEKLWNLVNTEPFVNTLGSVLTRFHSFSAPRLASVCSIVMLPRRRTTSAAL